MLDGVFAGVVGELLDEELESDEPEVELPIALAEGDPPLGEVAAPAMRAAPTATPAAAPTPTPTFTRRPRNQPLRFSAAVGRCGSAGRAPGGAYHEGGPAAGKPDPTGPGGGPEPGGGPQAP